MWPWSTQPAQASCIACVYGVVDGYAPHVFFCLCVACPVRVVCEVLEFLLMLQRIGLCYGLGQTHQLLCPMELFTSSSGSAWDQLSSLRSPWLVCVMPVAVLVCSRARRFQQCCAFPLLCRSLTLLVLGSRLSVGRHYFCWCWVVRKGWGLACAFPLGCPVSPGGGAQGLMHAGQVSAPRCPVLWLKSVLFSKIFFFVLNFTNTVMGTIDC